MAAKKVQYGLGEETPKTPLCWLYLPFMLLLGLGSMVLATQRIAAFFEYQASLGQPWGHLLRLSLICPVVGLCLARTVRDKRYLWFY